MTKFNRHCARNQLDPPPNFSPAGRGALEKRISKPLAFILVVIGAALAISANAADPGLTLAPADPTFGQAAPPAPQTTNNPLTADSGFVKAKTSETNDSWFVLAGNADAFAPQPLSIWQGDVGEGFRSDVRTLSLETGVALGVQAFGGRQVHDLALLSLSYGHMLGNVVNQNHWYRGNWEARAELFGGGQFSPRSDPLVGLTPHLRYNLATGTRWVPFADLGAGVMASGIGPPDQSGTFEFNLQANVGTHWFVRDNLALTFEVGFLHMSCAGIHDPNLGVNTIKGMAGLTWFF